MINYLGGSPVTNNTTVTWYQVDGRYGYIFRIIVEHGHSEWFHDGYYNFGSNWIETDTGAIYATWNECKSAMARLYNLLMDK